MAKGLRHSTPLKEKNQREQQSRQKATLKSPLYSTFKVVLSATFLKTQFYKKKLKMLNFHTPNCTNVLVQKINIGITN